MDSVEAACGIGQRESGKSENSYEVMVAIHLLIFKGPGNWIMTTGMEKREQLMEFGRVVYGEGEMIFKRHRGLELKWVGNFNELKQVILEKELQGKTLLSL